MKSAKCAFLMFAAIAMLAAPLAGSVRFAQQVRANASASALVADIGAPGPLADIGAPGPLADIGAPGPLADIGAPGPLAA
jgi:hypothetical protein